MAYLSCVWKNMTQHTEYRAQWQSQCRFVESQMKYTDAELARVSVLILRCHENSVRVTCGKRLASVIKNFNKKIDRKNLNFVNKTAI